MLKFIVRIALFAIVLGLVLPQAGLATITGGLLAALGVAAVCCIIAGVANSLAGLAAVPLAGAIMAAGGIKVWVFLLIRVLNQAVSLAVHALSVKLTAVLIAQHFAISSGLWPVLAAAVLLTLACALTGGSPLTLSVKVTTKTTTTVSRTTRSR